MEVLVKLHYVLKAYAPGGDFKKPFPLVVAENVIVSDILTILGMPTDREYLLFVGSERSARNRPLVNGETVTILPPIIGG